MSDCSLIVRAYARSPISCAALLCAPWLLCACPVDTRTLSASVEGSGATAATAGHGGSLLDPGRGGSGGNPTPGGAVDAGDAGESAGAADGEGGAAGEGGTASFQDPCPDLNADGESDCTHSIAKNFSFDSDVSNWIVESTATLVWDPSDLREREDSGSARLTSTQTIDADGAGLVTASQCILVQAGQTIELFARAKLDPGIDSGKAALGLWFFPGSDCPEQAFVGVYQTPEAAGSSEIAMLRGSAVAPDGAGSARVRLVAIKAFRAASFSVRFDDVLVVAH